MSIVAFSKAQTADRVWHTYAVVFGALCVMVGVYWDISWHMTIGRDTFWTPAHLMIQGGGLLAGLTSGFVVLKSTFLPSDRDIETGVRVWGFRGPLGAWLCIWGCFAMLASAPFDNWWHNAYGLDVKIVSPPHTVLAWGIYAIANGALMLTLAQQNRNEGRKQRRFAWLYLVAGGLFIMNFGIFLTEYSLRFLQHGAEFYRMSAAFYPFGLVAIAASSKKKWAATIAAGVYMGIMLLMMWGLQPFHAEPKLGPIYQPITHMVTLAWPLWLIVPAAGIDLLRQHWRWRVPQLPERWQEWQVWLPRLELPAEALAMGVVFSALFVAIQWPWSAFMVLSRFSRNWFFNADNFVYWASPAYVERAHHFAPSDSPFGQTVLIVVVLASLSSLVGLAWGRWMIQVRR
ncbi:MAG TPA: hypothetical protein VIV65_03085 [Gemmatimonadaceae bacterium]|jgi:hypothetical membrane protein